MNYPTKSIFKRKAIRKCKDRYDHLEDWLKRNAHLNDHTYQYEILYTGATHTETKERLVVYRALYSNEEMGVEYYQVFARPYDMFMSEVDHEKYPDVKQKYRFEIELQG